MSDASIGQYGTPEYNQLLASLRVAIKQLEMAEEWEYASGGSFVPTRIVQAQSRALSDIRTCAIALAEYYVRLGNTADIPF